MSRPATRLRPTAVDAERSLLGALLTEPERIPDVSAVVNATDFHVPHHAALYRLLGSLWKAGETVDLVTVPMRITSDRTADRYGGIGYVVDLPSACPSPQAAPSYAKAVRDSAIRRRLLELSEQLAERSTSGDLDVSDVVAGVTMALGRLHDGQGHAHGIDEVFDEVLGAMDRVHRGDEPPALSTGYGSLDDALGGGLRPGELTILAARPGMGKTAVSMNIACMAASLGPVGVFSMEMPRQQLVSRLIPMFSGVPLDRVVDARKLSGCDWGRVVDARDQVAALQLVIDDTPALRLAELQTRARAMVARGARLIVVDYLGKLHVDGRDQVREIGRNVSGLKDLARAERVPVVCLAQLNRDVEKRANKRPTMSDLRDSGEVEQEADAVVFVYREAVYDTAADPVALELIIAKARMGRLGTVRMSWNGPMQLVNEEEGPL